MPRLEAQMETMAGALSQCMDIQDHGRGAIRQRLHLPWFLLELLGTKGEFFVQGGGLSAGKTT